MIFTQGQLVGPELTKGTSLKSGVPCQAAVRCALLSHCYREVPRRGPQTPGRAWAQPRSPGCDTSSDECVLLGASNRHKTSAIVSKIEVAPHLPFRVLSWPISPLIKMQNQKESEATKKVRTKRSGRPQVPELKTGEPGGAIS